MRTRSGIAVWIVRHIAGTVSAAATSTRRRRLLLRAGDAWLRTCLRPPAVTAGGRHGLMGDYGAGTARPVASQMLPLHELPGAAAVK